MTTALPTGWQGRLLALSLLLVALAIAWLTIAEPLRGLYAEQQSQIANRRALLGKLDAVAAELPALHARVASLRGSMESRRLTLDGASDSIASASLQGHIEQYAARAGVTVGSTEILPAQAQGEYRRIGLRLMINGHYDSLTKLLSELETATPPLVVGDLQIRSMQWRLGAHPNMGLDASLEIYGFRATDAPASAKP